MTFSSSAAMVSSSYLPIRIFTISPGAVTIASWPVLTSWNVHLRSSRSRSAHWSKAPVAGLQHRDHVLDVQLEVDLGPRQVGALAEPGERRRVDLVPGVAQQAGNFGPAPAAVPGAVHEHESFDGHRSVTRRRGGAVLLAAGLEARGGPAGRHRARGGQGRVRLCLGADLRPAAGQCGQGLVADARADEHLAAL